jgi:hypothetical protein
MIYELLEQTDLKDGQENANSGDEDEPGLKNEERRFLAGRDTFDALMMELENIDLMFDWFDSEDRYERLKRNRESREILEEIKSG